MTQLTNRFETTYNRDFGHVQGFSGRRRNLSSSTSNLFNSRDSGNLGGKTKKNVWFKTPKSDASTSGYESFPNSLGVQPMRRSSSHQNLNSDSNAFQNKRSLFGSDDDFDSGFSSEDSNKEGRFFIFFARNIFSFNSLCLNLGRVSITLNRIYIQSTLLKNLNLCLRHPCCHLVPWKYLFIVFTMLYFSQHDKKSK